MPFNLSQKKWLNNKTKQKNIATIFFPLTHPTQKYTGLDCLQTIACPLFYFSYIFFNDIFWRGKSCMPDMLSSLMLPRFYGRSRAVRVCHKRTRRRRDRSAPSDRQLAGPGGKQSELKDEVIQKIYEMGKIVGPRSQGLSTVHYEISK